MLEVEDPRMIENFNQRQPEFWVLIEQRHNQIFVFIADSFFESYISPKNFLWNLNLGASEWGFSMA